MCCPGMVIYNGSISAVQCGVIWGLKHSLLFLLTGFSVPYLQEKTHVLSTWSCHTISNFSVAKPGAPRVWLKTISLLYKVRTSRMGTLELRGVLMEIIKHIIASGKVIWAIFWKYKNKEILNNDWKAWFDHRKFCFLVELSVLWDCFFFFLSCIFELCSKLGCIRLQRKPANHKSIWLERG